MSFPNNNYRRAGKYPAATVDEIKRSLNPEGLAQAANCSQNEPDEARTCKPAFNDDFLLEHSHFSQQSDSKDFAGCF